MGGVDAIERAVKELSHEELSTFREWFLEYDAQLWDQQLERDVAQGRLDSLADEALRDFHEGRTRPL